MIQYEPKHLCSVLFRVHGSIFIRMIPRVLVAAAIGHLAYVVYTRTGLHFPTIVHTMIGVALGLLLVFRTNASYDRYWEGRKLLGAMTNRCRDLARQAAAYLHSGPRERVRQYVCAFFHLTAAALRDDTTLGGAEAFLSPKEREALAQVVHRPPVVANWITRLLAEETLRGHLSEERLGAMDANLTALIDALGGAERIHRTPVPFAYAQHIKIFVVLFVLTAPFAMVDSTRACTALASALLAFALFGIDEIGVEIEDPFGEDPNDLPIDAIGSGIERATADILAQATLATACDGETETSASGGLSVASSRS